MEFLQAKTFTFIPTLPTIKESGEEKERGIVDETRTNKLTGDHDCKPGMMYLQNSQTLGSMNTLEEDREQKDEGTRERSTVSSVESQSERQMTVVEFQEEARQNETEEGTLWLRCTRAFNWDDFFYSLILGLGPTAWDVIGDFVFGSALEQSGDFTTAGFCYFIICLPGMMFLLEFLLSRLQKAFSIPQKGFDCLNVATVIISVATWVTCFLVNPLLFKYPAQVTGLFMVSTKVLAVFVHLPEIKQFSMKMTFLETNLESTSQLNLLLNVWLQGGSLYLSPILSSILVIGKNNTEIYLADNPENKLKGKTSLEKLQLVFSHLPRNSTTIFFRVGSIPLKVTNHFSGAFGFYTMSHVIYLNLIHFFILIPLKICILKVFLKHVFPQLKDLSVVDFWQIAIGEQSCTIPWPRLGRLKAREPQFAMATFYLISNMVYISFLQSANFLEKRDGTTFYCNLLYSCGLLSYILTILHFYVFPLDRRNNIDGEPASQGQAQEI